MHAHAAFRHPRCVAQGVRGLCTAPVALGLVGLLSFLVTDSDLPFHLLCLFPPLVIWLFHFNLIRTPRQEKAMQGVLTAALWELVTRCPLSLMGIWRQGHLSWFLSQYS